MATADGELKRPERPIENHATGVLAPEVRAVVPEVELRAQAGEPAQLLEIEVGQAGRTMGGEITAGARHGDQARGARGPAAMELRGALALAVGEIQGGVHEIGKKRHPHGGSNSGLPAEIRLA